MNCPYCRHHVDELEPLRDRKFRVLGAFLGAVAVTALMFAV